jgi:hypothetical protein
MRSSLSQDLLSPRIQPRTTQDQQDNQDPQSLYDLLYGTYGT